MDLKRKHPARTSRSLAKGVPEIALGGIVALVLLVAEIAEANLDAEYVAIVAPVAVVALQFIRRQFRDWFGVTDA